MDVMASSASSPAAQAQVLQAKAELRVLGKARRAALDADIRHEGAMALARFDFNGLIGPPPRVVSAFRSLGEELDTGPLLNRLGPEGYQLCLPVMQGCGRPLIFRAWAPGDIMAKAVWGIEEPTADRPELAPEVVLAPLLAFDRAGWRLGYGGGFFDRTLRRLRQLQPVLAVGLAFAVQEIDAVPHLDYDEALDAVLTPEGLIDCRAQRSGNDAPSFPR